MKLTETQEKFVQSFLDRQKAYKLMLDSEMGKTVLKDLSEFCYEKKTCFFPDARVHAALEGRREVILRIRDHLELSSEEFIQKYIKKIKGTNNE